MESANESDYTGDTADRIRPQANMNTPTSHEQNCTHPHFSEDSEARTTVFHRSSISSKRCSVTEKDFGSPWSSHGPADEKTSRWLSKKRLQQYDRKC